LNLTKSKKRVIIIYGGSLSAIFFNWSKIGRHKEKKYTETTGNLIRLVAEGGIIVLGGSIIAKIIRFILHVILARILGVINYGMYSLGQSVIDILAYIGSLGDGKGMVMFGAIYLSEEDYPRLKGMIVGFLLLSFSISVILSMILFVFADYIALRIFHDFGLAAVFRMFSFGMPFYILTIGCTAIAITFRKVKYKIFIQDMCQPIVNIIAVVVMFILGIKLAGALWGFIASSIASAFLGLFLVKKSFSRRWINVAGIFEIKKLLFYSAPVIFIISIYFLIFEIDKIMLGIMCSPGDVGIYSVASNIAMIILMFYGIFEASFSPIMAQLYHHGRIFKLKKIYNLVTFWGIWLAFLPCLCFLFFSREILSLFGNDFEIGRWVLIILTVAFFIEITFGLARQLLQMCGKQNIEFFNSLICIFVNLILNLILIPRFGIIGAALATSISLLVISLIRLFEIRIIFGFVPFSQKCLKFFIFSIVIIFISLTLVINIELVPRFILATCIFISFVLISSKSLTREDLLVWGSLRRRIFMKTS